MAENQGLDTIYVWYMPWCGTLVIGKNKREKRADKRIKASTAATANNEKKGMQEIRPNQRPVHLKKKPRTVAPKPFEMHFNT